MESQPCNKCACPLIWDYQLKDPRPEGKAKNKGWWKEDLTKELHTLERCKKFQETKEFQPKQLEGRWSDQITPERKEVARTDYGKIPDWLADAATTIKDGWKGYASIAAELVDEVQPTLDNRTRSMAVSAVIDQIIQMEKIKAIKSLRSEKE